MVKERERKAAIPPRRQAIFHEGACLEIEKCDLEKIMDREVKITKKLKPKLDDLRTRTDGLDRE